MIVGLSSTLPQSLFHGLTAHGVPAAVADRAAHLPPVSTLFAAFLGYNPIEHLIGAGTLAHLSAAQQKVLLGHGFFPGLITAPFRAGLHAALDFAIVASVLAAAASWSRGAMYVHHEPTAGEFFESDEGPPPSPGEAPATDEGKGTNGAQRAEVAAPVGGAPVSGAPEGRR
jgi:hypothetical protein